MAECNGNLFQTDIGELPLLFTTMKAVAGSCIANSIGTIVKAPAARKADWGPKVDPTFVGMVWSQILRLAHRAAWPSRICPGHDKVSSSCLGKLPRRGGPGPASFPGSPAPAGKALRSSHIGTGPGTPKSATWNCYRCQPHFRALTSWLRDHGTQGDKPIDVLRKEFGSRINAKCDIHAASPAVWHADIGITAQFYADSRKRVTTGFGHLFKSQPAKVVSIDDSATDLTTGVRTAAQDRG
jgi:hypothetical protein